jgi:CAAX prenyl protease-like protein
MRSRASRLGEGALVFGLFLAAAWLAPLFPGARLGLQAVIGTAALLVIVAGVRRDGVAPSELGLRLDNFFGAAAVFLFLDAVALVPHAGFAGPHDVRARDVLVYCAWALFQQLVVTAGFWRHFRPTTGRASSGDELRASAAAAALFALAHAPNLPLMGLVFGAELVWLLAFSRFRNLFALALAHAVAALVVKHELVGTWLQTMKVGLGYWRP